MKPALWLYHRLPPPAWSLAASLRAWRLRERRFGAMFAEAVPRIVQRTTASATVLRAYQSERLATMLREAAESVPAYRGLPVPKGAEDALETLARWPLLDLQRLRRSPADFHNPAHMRGPVIHLSTSGTTGTPKQIVRDAEAEQLNYAYAEVRWKMSAGVDRNDRWVMIGGQLVVPVARRKPPFWVRAWPLRQLYMSSYHLAHEHAEAYMRALAAWRPAYLLGYASSLDQLAMFAESTGIRLPVRAVISNAEPLFAHVRERLARVFGCAVRDTYGSTEGVLQAFECAHGRMHVSTDFGVFEILAQDGTPAPAGVAGRVVVTGLTNRAMPLVRYEIGDTATWAARESCPCGSSFPVLAAIEGRTDDLLELPDGRRIGRLDPVFKGGLPIREAQIVQRVDGSVDVRFVAEDGGRAVWAISHEQQLLRELRARLGEAVAIRLERVERIERSANGKFKTVVKERV